MSVDPRQARYAAHRRDWRDAHPPAVVTDGPPALNLTPPLGPTLADILARLEGRAHAAGRA